MGFPGGSDSKESAWNAEPGSIPEYEISLEKEMAAHSNILVHGRIPWTEEPGGLPSMGSHRVGHNLVTENNNIPSPSPVCRVS